MAVVAAAMRDGSGRWLLQKRPAEKRHGGLWEFPGGKVEAGETGPAALVRELNEELTIAADRRDLAAVGQSAASAGDGEPAIVITLYSLTRWQGTPVPEPGAELGWFGPGELARLPLPPLDRDLAAQLLARADKGIAKGESQPYVPPPSARP